ncbi:unnamed protein product [Adineta ricciae]|uniref:Leucine carboxyl methyltransferase n=1 Tax=Adineta ricciae TaxID=249248 RepID=A0A815U1K4_ADIRI|nr:unnamed protein product [Adineta ricciae]
MKIILEQYKVDRTASNELLHILTQTTIYFTYYFHHTILVHRDREEYLELIKRTGRIPSKFIQTKNYKPRKLQKFRITSRKIVSSGLLQINMSAVEQINANPVGRTSMTSATARANESLRPNALFRDPFARIYAGQSLSRQILLLSVPENSTPVAFYLLDVPEVLAYRQKCFEKLESSLPKVNRSVAEIACNLVNDEWPAELLHHGFKPDQPTFWLAEGLFHYLTKQDIQKLLERIQKLSAKNSCITFDLVSPRLLELLPIIKFALDDEQEIRRIFHEFNCEDIECMSFENIGLTYRRTVSRDRTFIVTAKLFNQYSHLSN